MSWKVEQSGYEEAPLRRNAHTYDPTMLWWQMWLIIAPSKYAMLRHSEGLIRVIHLVACSMHPEIKMTEERSHGIPQ